MSDQVESRIAVAKRRAAEAKQRLALGAAAAFVVAVWLAWGSHPGSTAAASDDPSVDGGSVLVSDDDDDDFGGFHAFGGLAPSGGAVPQVQSHVS